MSGIAEWLEILVDHSCASPPIPLALLVSIVLVIWGNAVVVRSERVRARKGERAAEAVTLVAHFAAGLTTIAAALWAGFSARDLGLAAPRFGRPPTAVLVALTGLVLGVISLVVIGFVRDRGEADHLWKLRVSRLLIGTAGGEECLFRGFLLALWAGTGANNPVILTANAVTFGLWHVAGARKEDGFRWGEVVGPGSFAVVFVAARLALDSLVLPWLLHAAINLPGVALSPNRPKFRESPTPHGSLPPPSTQN